MADTILTSDDPSNSSQKLIHPSTVICRVCQKQFSQYTCPRCYTRYCSLPCYKSHSLRCTESFMRENVVQEMQQLRADDSTKQKMLDILKRFHSKEEEEEEEMDSMDEDDSTLSQETIEKIMSGAQFSFDDLSMEEKKHFQRALASGDLNKLIEPWEPWWLKPSAKTLSLSHDGTQLVQPLVTEETSDSHPGDLNTDHAHDIPPGPDAPLPPLHKLTAVEPSPLLTIHLIDILYAYCFTLRLYNGEWESDAMESALVVLSISSVLSQHGRPETVSEALSYCLEQTCSPTFRHVGGTKFGLGLLDDVTTLLSLGSDALVCALCDLHRLIQAAERELKLEKGKNSKRVEIKKQLRFAEKKVYFMMCWVHEQLQEVWSSLEALVTAEKNAAAMAYGGDKRASLRVENEVKNSGKTLIEEV